MITSLDVENQRFEFGEQWSVAFKYDDTAFYRKEANRLQGDIGGIPHSTKAVDIVGVHDVSGLLLLEAKDFRRNRIANKPRIKGEVAVEVAFKVRDTIAAFLGASRKPVDEFPAEHLAGALQRGAKVTVVLWLEDDSFRDSDHAKQTLSVLNGELKSKLAWLNVKTFVLSSNVANRLPNLKVSNLPSASQPNS